VKLFDRVGKRVYLTEAGALLQPRARALLSEISDTEMVLRNLHRRVDGRLAMATSHHVGLHRLAPVLKAFTQRHPDAVLDIEFVDSEAAHELVRSGGTELAVVTLAPVIDPALAYERLWRDPLAFVAAGDHRLCGERNISLERLATYPAILPGLGTYTGRIVAERFARAALPLRTAMATNYLETIGMLVGIGLGWSVLPATMIRPPLARLDVDCELLGRDLGAVTNPARTLSNPARAFLSVLREFAD
jgi:DNA-binding transcriptional LysR family regulator